MAARKKLTALALLFVLPAAGLLAQAETTIELEAGTWMRVMWNTRRFEIVTFGSFPFTMFFSTIGMDLFRWQRATGMDWSQRQYAPWPIKSAGAVRMTNREQGATIAIAAGLSVGIALADYFVVQSRRRRAIRAADALPGATIVITRTPLHGEGEDDAADEPDPESAGAAPGPPLDEDPPPPP